MVVSIAGEYRQIRAAVVSQTLRYLPLFIETYQGVQVEYKELFRLQYLLDSVKYRLNIFKRVEFVQHIERKHQVYWPQIFTDVPNIVFEPAQTQARGIHCPAGSLQHWRGIIHAR